MPDLVIDCHVVYILGITFGVAMSVKSCNRFPCCACYRNLGVAFGVAMSGGGVGGICIPLIITNLIQEEK